MVRFMEGPLGVQAEVRPLQTIGNVAHIDQEGSAATSQRVHEEIKAERVRDTSLIYIYILRMQSSVQAQRVGLGMEVYMQKSKWTKFWLVEDP